MKQAVYSGQSVHFSWTTIELPISFDVSISEECIGMWENRTAEMNSTILDVFKSRNINGEFSGTVIHFYSFSYEGKDDTWYKGEIFPVTSLKLEDTIREGERN